MKKVEALMIKKRENTIDYQDLGKRIQFYRTKKGITQQGLSDLIDVVPSNISHIERGTNHVSLPTLVRIAEVLEVSLDQLLCESVAEARPLRQNVIAELLSDCNQEELESITEVLVSVKKAIRK